MEVTSHHLAAGARSENLPFRVTVMYSDILAKCNTTIEEEAVERKKTAISTACDGQWRYLKRKYVVTHRHNDEAFCAPRPNPGSGDDLAK